MRIHSDTLTYSDLQRVLPAGLHLLSCEERRSWQRAHAFEVTLCYEGMDLVAAKFSRSLWLVELYKLDPWRHVRETGRLSWSLTTCIGH